MNYAVEVVLDAQVSLGEGPLWDETEKCLYWVDITGHKLHRFDPKSRIDETIDVGQTVGAVAKRRMGGLVLALQQGFYALDLDTRALSRLALLEKEQQGTRLNDGKVDPLGRFWAGSMATDDRAQTGSLYCLSTDHVVKTILQGVSISNGLAWSSDAGTMYYIDSPTREVMAYTFDAIAGTIQAPRVAVRIPDDQGVPDGMTIDEEGMIWVAHWGGWRVTRYNPHNGQVLDVIPLPVAQVSCCTFGGENLDELYITTARQGLSGEELKQQPHAGSLFHVQTTVRGMLTVAFAG